MRDIAIPYFTNKIRDGKARGSTSFPANDFVNVKRNCFTLRFEDVYYAYQDSGSGGFSLAADLAFAPGKIAAITGPNGSGKTTLGKLAAGLLRPARGRVLLGGEDIGGWPLGKIGGKIGYLFQEPSRQIFAPTVMEDICFPLILKGMKEEEARELAREALARFGMGALENASSFTLSRGEKQRLALAAMLVNNPRFLILDEPTTGLDSRRKGVLGEILRRLAAQGAGVVLISHDRDFIREQAAAPVFRMEEGRVVSP